MYQKENSNYKRLEPIGYSSNGRANGANYGVLNNYGSNGDAYKSLISESKCRCRGTCRTGIGCTCKE
jgi:hypothetical protein